MFIFKIHETGPTPRNILRKIGPINRATMAAMGTYWHDHYRAKHFTRAGAAEYGYANRTKGYMIRKAKVQGHQDPLVWSGRSRDLSKIKDVRASYSKGEARVRVVLRTPALNFIPRGGTINMRDEMTRVSESEMRELTRVAEQEQARQINAITDTTTTTIG